MQVNSINMISFGNKANLRNFDLVKSGELSTLPEYDRHEQNIIRTIGLEQYQHVCKLPNVTETKKLSYLLSNLDDNAMIIIGNPYTDENHQALNNHIKKYPELRDRIETAYIIPSDYDNAVFITTSGKEDDIGVEYFMVHTDGKIRIKTPFWSARQVGFLKDTRYLRPGDVFTVERDAHHIKLDTKNSTQKKPNGISTIDFDELL